MERTFHRLIRVVYRCCRKMYGIEKTQDECLRVFKVVFIEQYAAENSEEEYWMLNEEHYKLLCYIVDSWKPDKHVKEVCDESLQRLSKLHKREDFLQLCDDVTPVCMRIRKLTPRECGRLQGCDEWTIDKIENSGVSKSAQYKLYGNSITVDVLYWIFYKMFIDTEEEKVHGQQLSLF